MLDCTIIYIEPFLCHSLCYSISMATHYGLDGPGIESRCGWDFPLPSKLALGPTQPPVECFPGLKWPRRDVALPPHLPPRLKKEYRYNSTPPLCFLGLFYGEIYLCFSVSVRCCVCPVTLTQTAEVTRVTKHFLFTSKCRAGTYKNQEAASKS